MNKNVVVVYNGASLALEVLADLNFRMTNFVLHEHQVHGLHALRRCLLPTLGLLSGIGSFCIAPCSCLRRFLDEINAGIAVTTARPQSAFNRHLTAGVVEFPLYCEGVERTRFAYGIYLLNKVVPHSLCAQYPFVSTAALGLF